MRRHAVIAKFKQHGEQRHRIGTAAYSDNHFATFPQKAVGSDGLTNLIYKFHICCMMLFIRAHSIFRAVSQERIMFVNALRFYKVTIFS